MVKEMTNIDEEFRWAAKYPFDKRSLNLLKLVAFDINEYNKDDLRSILDHAYNRVKWDLEGKIEKSLIWKSDEDKMIAVEFYLALLIVKGCENEFIYRVFCEAESKRAIKLLKNEKNENILMLANHLNIKIKDEGSVFKIYYLDFVRLAKGLSSIHWKLFNFQVSKGWVILNKYEISRLLGERIKEHIYELLKNIPEVPQFIKNYSNKVKSLKSISIPRQNIITNLKDKRKYPPCIQTLLNNVDKGLSHSGRFTLVTFLNKVGYNIDDIVNIFKNTPDFNEQRTRYQVEHIVGHRGSRIVYTIPSCKKIRSYGFCFPNERCRGIFHPLQYLYKK